MKKKLFIIALAASLILSSCGTSSSPASQKFSELSAEYDYYQKSATNIQKYMEVDATQADEIFLILIECGVSSEINHISKNNDGSFATWSAGKEYTVALDGGIVSTVYDKKDQVYPENIHHNVLMDYDLIVKDVLNGTGDDVIGQYAYISIMDSQLEEVTADNLKEFAENRVAGTDYNWVSITTATHKGICFAGSNTLVADYGEVDKDGRITKTIGTWVLDTDGNYAYSE